MKTCRCCDRELPMSEYYVHKMMADGHFGSCKDCVIKKAQDYRYINLERLRVYGREYCRTHKQNKKQHAAHMRRSRRRHPEKISARNKASHAIKSGRLVRGPCAVCGITEKIHAHHEDYNKPLDVIWLCTKHHFEIHRKYDPLILKGQWA